MDETTARDLTNFGHSAAAVGAVAAGMGLAAYAVARMTGTPLCPRWRPPGVPWRASAALLIAFPLALVGSQVALGLAAAWSGVPVPEDPAAAERARFVRDLWGRVMATPLLLAAYLVLRRTVLKGSRFADPPGVGAFARNVALGAAGWAVLVPLTYAVHFVLQYVLGIGVDDHPLKASPPQTDGTGGVLFFVGVCVGTAIQEEAVFRGLLVPWAGQRRFAPWVLMLAAFLMAGMTAHRPVPALAFVAMLCLPLLFLQTAAPPKRFPRRTLAAVLASSAVFAAAHSSVWPTPLPLFVLACGLGWLTARTGSIVPGVVVHGLFNAVSSVMLYLDAAG